MKTFLFLSLTLTVALAVPVPEWVSVNPEEGGAPLARLLPEQGHVIQEDVKPDAGLEKVERPPAEVNPKVQEKDKPAVQEPILQDKPAEEEPSVQDKPAEEKPLEEDKPAEEKPLEEDKPSEQEPLEEDKPAEEEPSVEQVQEKVGEEDKSEGAAEEEDLTENEIKEDFPGQQETQLEEDEYVYDLKESLNTNFLPEEGPAMDSDYRSDESEEEEPVAQEIHPAPGRPRLVEEEPVVELVPEDEEAGMDDRLTEEEVEMVEEPKMLLIAEEGEPVEDDLGIETDLWDPRFRSVEAPTVELEPLLEEELTSDDEPGTEAQPAEEEEFLGEEGPVMPGEMVVEVEESLDQEPGMELDPEGEPGPRARSGLAEGPLMDGMTLKQAMMEEEPDMWVGPDVMQEGPEMEEDPDMARTGYESVAMARGMDIDNEMLVAVKRDIEQADEEEARPMEEFPDAGKYVVIGQ